MGEMADSLIDGEFDYITGEYIGPGCGFPRTRIVSRKSEDVSWKRVTGYMSTHGIKPHLHPKVIKEFGVPYTGKHPLRNACFMVLNDFDRFKEFVKRYKELEDESKTD